MLTTKIYWTFVTKNDGTNLTSFVVGSLKSLFKVMLKSSAKWPITSQFIVFIMSCSLNDSFSNEEIDETENDYGKNL